MPSGTAVVAPFVFRDSNVLTSTSVPNAVEWDETNLYANPASFSRTSPATRINQRGYLEEVASGLRRYTYNPSLTYNEDPNPFMDGGGPGSKPSLWGFIGAPGITAQYLGVGVDPVNGPYVDIRFQGTTSGAGSIQINTCSTYPQGMQVFPGDVVRAEIGAQIFRGTISNPSSWIILVSEYNASNTFLVGASVPVSVSTTVARHRHFKTMTDAQVRMANVSLQKSVGAGEALDFDIRVFFPVINLGVTYLTDSVPLGTLTNRVNGIPQYGLLGLLLEETVTNFAQWGRMEGGVAGSPGTVPTNAGFTSTTGSGITRTISYGLENNIPYADFRFAGTTTAANLQIIIGISNGTGAAAVAGDTFTASALLRLVGGSLPTTSAIRIAEGNASIFTASDSNISGITNAPLVSQRLSVTRTFTNGSTTFAQGLVVVVVPVSGTAVDFTIRVGAPQLERRAAPTSIILPAVGSPVATTRAADVYAGTRRTIAYTDSNITGSAASLTTPRNIELSGDASGLVSFNGSSNVTIPMVLASSGVTPGTYVNTTVVVDAKGRVTSASNGSGGGGGGPVTGTVEVDLGATPAKGGTFTIAGTGFVPGNPVQIFQAAGPYTGKGTMLDEAEMDYVGFTGSILSSTSIRVFWSSTTFVKGNVRLTYVLL